MNKFICVFTFVFIASCAPKKTIQQPLPETSATSNNSIEVKDSNAVIKDTTLVLVPPKNIPHNKIPDCIQKMIVDISNDPVQNPPRKIFSYTYKGKTVYYLTSVCCDQYSNLYDDKCNLLGHPDGGFTGRGDGKFPDFSKETTNEKLVWADKRK